MTDFCIDDSFIIDESAWIAPSALLLGRVRVGAHSSIWFQSLLRGDCDEIVIGTECNLQDGSVIHNMQGYPVILGDRVSFGHGVLAHGCIIEDDVLVGIRATILNGAKIGHHSLIAAGTLVPENAVIPPYSLVMGTPGKVVKQVSEKHLALIADTASHYVQYSQAYKRRFPNTYMTSPQNRAPGYYV